MTLQMGLFAVTEDSALAGPSVLTYEVQQELVELPLF